MPWYKIKDTASVQNQLALVHHQGRFQTCTAKRNTPSMAPQQCSVKLQVGLLVCTLSTDSNTGLYQSQVKLQKYAVEIVGLCWSVCFDSTHTNHHCMHCIKKKKKVLQKSCYIFTSTDGGGVGGRKVMFSVQHQDDHASHNHYYIIIIQVAIFQKCNHF